MFLLIVLFAAVAFCTLAGSSALPSTPLPEKALVGPTSLNNKTTIERLFKRAVSCSFNSELTGFCDNTAYCCWKFAAGADSVSNGGFCCTNDQDTGGGCCGNTCCPYGQYCAWADSLGNYACISDGQVGSGYPTVTQVVTQISTDFFTETETESVTFFQTIIQTQHETDIQTAAQTAVETQHKTDVQTTTKTQKVTNIQTVIQSVTILQTLLSTTTNNAGEAITQTFTVSSVCVAATAGSGVGVTSSNKTNNAGAIAGGVVGGLALLALVGLTLFAGIRRGWFDRRNAGSAPNRPSMSLHWGN